MVAIPFINKTKKTKFKGSFHLDSNDYEYTIYLLPITKQKEFDEIVTYFGNRMFKGAVCLEVDEEAVENYINDDDVSAFIMVNPVGIDNVASGTLQIFDWCINPPNFSPSSGSKSTSSKSSSINDADVWINDVCRVSSSGNIGNPLRGLFYIMEQLVSQNLHKTNIKLYIDSEPDNVSILKPKYESLGFVKNFTDTPDICPNWKGTEIVMEKTGLIEEPHIIDFSFLEQIKPARSATRKTTRITAKGIRKHKNTHRKHGKIHYKRK